VRKFLFFSCFLSIAFSIQAQWNPVALNYKHLKRPDYFIPNAMHFSDTSNGVLLTTAGLMQLKENLWRPANIIINDTLPFTYTNVFTINPRNTFLCGYDGKVSLFNGDSIRVLFLVDESETVNIMLNTIFMIDSVNGWAAGENGTVVKIEGSNHIMQNLPPMYSFRDMYFDTPEHGWMIGYVQEHIDDGGVVFEFKDGFWDVHSTLNGQLFDIEFSSPGNGFIAGQQAIYRFNNTANEWQAEDITDYYQQFHLSMLNDDYGISVSDNNTNFVYEDGVWFHGPAAAIEDLESVKTIGYGAAWGMSQIGNNDPSDFNNGKIQRLQDNVWETVSLKYLDSVFIQPTDFAITSINAIDEENIWFNGQYAGLTSYKNWPDIAPVINSDTFYAALKMFSQDFGLGFNGNLLEWNGQYWIDKKIDPVINPDTSVTNVCIHVFNDTSGFICRQYFTWSSGEIRNSVAKYNYQTNSLTPVASLGTKSPYAIHFADTENGWIVGDSGLTVRYANHHWQTFPAITNKRLTAVFSVDESTAWAVGDEGRLLKYNGSTWARIELPTEQNLHSIYFTNSNDGWITGDSGLIFRYNGTGWTRDSSGTTSALYTIYMFDSTYGFAGGDNGLVLQYKKPLPPVAQEKKFCEFGDTYFVYQPEGNSYVYQWQVDTGNGFENITDDMVFSGTANDTLWLTAMPSNLYGYKFRCIASFEGVDSVSKIEELKFVNHWTGAVSSAWEDSGNWSCGSLPGENTDVVIISGEIIINTDENIRSLSVSPGVNITLAEGSALTILK
jgi:photosystem II stability/assembly factor-like uncharacterized protein